MRDACFVELRHEVRSVGGLGVPDAHLLLGECAQEAHDAHRNGGSGGALEGELEPVCGSVIGLAVAAGSECPVLAGHEGDHPFEMGKAPPARTGRALPWGLLLWACASSFVVDVFKLFDVEALGGVAEAFGFHHLVYGCSTRAVTGTQARDGDGLVAEQECHHCVVMLEALVEARWNDVAAYEVHEGVVHVPCGLDTFAPEAVWHADVVFVEVVVALLDASGDAFEPHVDEVFWRFVYR